MIGSIEVSPMQAGEASRLCGIVEAIVSRLSYYSDRAREEEIAKYTERELSKAAQEDVDSVLVARDGEQIVGFCISRYDDGVIWLSWFATVAEYRGRGVGRAMLSALSASLPSRRAHKIWCDTRTENIASQHVLEAFGFRRLVEIKNHWYGQDFYLWEWLPQ